MAVLVIDPVQAGDANQMVRRPLADAHHEVGVAARHVLDERLLGCEVGRPVQQQVADDPLVVDPRQDDWRVNLIERAQVGVAADEEWVVHAGYHNGRKALSMDNCCTRVF
jgi:hypothetical protein